MPRRNVMLACPSLDGFMLAEVCDFMTYAAVKSVTEHSKYVNSLFRPKMTGYKTDVARNVIVEEARKHDCELLVMIDSDMRVPMEFWDAVVECFFNRGTKGPTGPFVLGVPYCKGPPREDVNVFAWAAQRSCGDQPHPNYHAKLTHIPREDATRRKGIEQVANIGTGCVAYTLDVFDRIDKPYYEYQYNEDHTAMPNSEDTICHQKMVNAGIPIYVHWDCWASHWKPGWVDRPYVLTVKDGQRFVEQGVSHGK